MKNQTLNLDKIYSLIFIFLFIGLHIHAQTIAQDAPYTLVGPTENLTQISTYSVYENGGNVDYDVNVNWKVKGGTILNEGATTSNGISQINIFSYNGNIVPTIEVQWFEYGSEHYIEANIVDYYGDSWFFHVDFTIDITLSPLNPSNTTLGNDYPYTLELLTDDPAEISKYSVYENGGSVDFDLAVSWKVKGGVILNQGATMSNEISQKYMYSSTASIVPTIEVQWFNDTGERSIEASIVDYYGESWLFHKDFNTDTIIYQLNTSTAIIGNDNPYNLLGPIESLTQISKYDISGNLGDVELDWSVKGGVILNQQATISNGISHLNNNASSIEVRWIDNEEDHYVYAFLLDSWYGDYWIIHTDLTMDSTPDFTSTPTVLSNENYIYTINYQEGYTEAGLSNVPNSDKIESVTYFDGLGRPKQQIAIRGGGQGQDILTHIQYNDFSRKDKDYLPYIIGTNGGAFRTGALDETNSFYDKANYEADFPGMTTATINPYSQKLFEASPLNRVLQQAAPGASWKLGTGHEIKFNYQTNVAGEVKLYSASATWNATSGLFNTSLVNGAGTVFYGAGQLYKTITYDENTTATPTETNGSTVEFKNKQGQVVLKRTYNEGVKHDTYYVYDDYGNLTYVIPPKADFAITTAILDDLCYQYKYDSRNRLAEKKIPGKQWEFIVYDNLDRPVATGPAFSPFTSPIGNGWLITKYDAFNRPVITAWMPASVTSAGRKALQDARNSERTNLSETKIATTANTTINGVAFRYTNVAFPTSGYHVLTVSYFDDYNFPNAPAIPVKVEEQTVYYNTTVKPKGLPTGTWTRVLETSTLYKNEMAYSLYDSKARPIRSYVKNYLGGYTYVDSKLDFTGKPEYIITKHKLLGTSTELTTREEFVYTDQGRLLTQTNQINGGTKQLIAKNDYDELGQLISKKVGGTDITGNTGLQTVDYTYNVRGWLKQINDPTSLGTDLFGFKLNYNTKELGSTNANLYNGNISETIWKTANDVNSNKTRGYAYSYDALNRIIYADYGIKTTGSYNLGSGYDMQINVYDKNGNIKDLSRYGASGKIDQLTYNYFNNEASNKLLKVADAISGTDGFKNGSTGDDYVYDANGNMTSDANKGITAITYNHLNLPTSVTLPGGTISYIYDATGVKLEKKLTEGINVTKTLYAGNYVYKKVNSNAEELKFFNQPEGYVEYNGGSFNYVYNYTDHLGNIRLSYTDINQNNSNPVNLKIAEENNYYPFGLNHKGYNDDGNGYGSSAAKKYKFGGKELQDDNIGGNSLDWYDVSARNYDPALGRWMNLDPLAEQMRRHSPYNYAFNNPIYWIDPDGMAPLDIWKLEQNGSLVWVAEDKTKDIIYSTNANGNITEDSNKLELEKGSITGEFSTKNSEGVVVKNEETANSLLTFSADNLDGQNGNAVEMGSVTAFSEVGDSKSVVITSKSPEGVSVPEAALELISEGYKDRVNSEHSHPGNTELSKIPSGYASDGKRYPSQDLDGDGKSAEFMNNKTKNKGTHTMYHPQTKKTTVFDEKSYRKIN